MGSNARDFGFALFQAYYGVSRYLRTMYADNGIEDLGPTELGILLLLAERDGRRMSEIAQLLNVQKSTLTGVVDRMEKAGRVERRPDPEDGRAQRVHLTLDARYRAQSVRVLVEKGHSELTAGLTPEE
ncbi:MAG: MarR family transcriptional regulator, partial [Candidatus Methylomirabilis sp.]|nr:MarR family transcriptional regulator [Deltaproteobacteria bacterium]